MSKRFTVVTCWCGQPIDEWSGAHCTRCGRAVSSAAIRSAEPRFQLDARPEWGPMSPLAFQLG